MKIILMTRLLFAIPFITGLFYSCSESRPFVLTLENKTSNVLLNLRVNGSDRVNFLPNESKVFNTHLETYGSFGPLGGGSPGIGISFDYSNTFTLTNVTSNYITNIFSSGYGENTSTYFVEKASSLYLFMAITKQLPTGIVGKAMISQGANKNTSNTSSFSNQTFTNYFSFPTFSVDF